MKLFKVILFFAFTIVFGWSVGVVYHHRPLVSSHLWSATIQANGEEELRGEVYEMLGQRNKLFVRFPTPVPEYLPGHPWLSFDPDLQLVAVPNWPSEKPYLNFNHDMSMGRSLSGKKVGRDWEVSWNSTGFEARDSHRVIKLTRRELRAQK